MSTERDIYFLMLPGLLPLDWAGPWQAFLAANEAGARFRLQAIGAAPAVALKAGLSLSGFAPLPERLPANALLLIPGVHGWRSVLDTAECARVLAWLPLVLGPSHTLATVCAGAMIAAQAGLLAGRRCTTHHELTEELAALEPRALVQEGRIFVADGPLYTSAGITAGIDLALHLIGEWGGPGMAMAVARELVVYLRRGGEDPQLSPWLEHRNHLQARIHRVQDRIAREPGRHFSLEELAGTAHVSVRHLTRLFRAATGISLLDYQTGLRLAHARRLLAETRHNLERIAELSGFGSARQLRRQWLARFGTLPSDDRAA
ncbi:MAG: helix-turn-helix domain-containing protein [Gammaproteobacteria bacterium]|nr:helix-turn-helix domain-containing protein [Gammaproteobacteria bacterium]